MAQASSNHSHYAYNDAGSGPPVILLHGFPFDRTMWQEQVDALSPHCRVLTPDLRGLGESENSTGVATMSVMAHDIASLMDTLDIAQAAIGGLSMGGYVALAFYRLFPQRVSSLILADTRAQADDEEARKNRERQAEKVLLEGMPSVAGSMLPKLLAPETVSKRPEIVKRIRDMMLRQNPEGAAAALRGMAERMDQTDLLGRIVAPSLIIVGREDVITPPEDAERMHEQISGSRLEIIEKAGHVSNMEQPEAFNRALLSFLNH